VVGVEVKHAIRRAHGHPPSTEGIVLGHTSHRNLGLSPAPDVAHGVSAPGAEGVGVTGLAGKRVTGILGVSEQAGPVGAVLAHLQVVARHAGTGAIAGRPGDGDAGRL
jgi:hypothetical protein